MLSMIFQNPILFLAWITSIVIAITAHEFFHAWTANILGDSTARDEGRLSLNPLAHLDPMGTILLLLIGFGWGKPVPFNPYNLRDQRWGPALVALAGPLSNLGMAIIGSLALNFVLETGSLVPKGLEIFLNIFIYLNLILMVFNLIPIPPLDGSKVLFAILSLSEKAKFMLEHNGPFLLLTFILLDQFLALSILRKVVLGAVKILFSLLVPEATNLFL